MTESPEEPDRLVAALRRAGCVFAEEEAAVLRESAGSTAHLERLVRARAAGAPLEQLVGWVEFGGLRLRVGPGVFVPRQRTRLLAEIAVAAVETAGRKTSERSPPVFIEAFAGVAPIAAAVRAAHRSAELHATDFDEAALRYARVNLEGTAGVHPGSVLRGLPDRIAGRVSVIAAVPPYVPDGEAGLLPREARDHESPAALFGGADGLDAVRALIGEAPQWLTLHGTVLVEMHSAQVSDATRIAEHHGFTTTQHSAADSQTVVLELSRAPR
ncbi:MAG TPA: SAM-dependent methyltransferase [Brevibacterium sp.]|nr:SAM-dependent methyltransferase [Brevibacterium sp.]